MTIVSLFFLINRKMITFEDPVFSKNAHNDINHAVCCGNWTIINADDSVG